MPVQRPQRHHRDDRHAVRVGDDAEMARSAAAPFTSGTTSGTPGSMRNAEELSTTTAPWRTAIGTNRRDVVPPAENSAMIDAGKAVLGQLLDRDALAAEQQGATGGAGESEQAQPGQRESRAAPGSRSARCPPRRWRRRWRRLDGSGSWMTRSVRWAGKTSAWKSKGPVRYPAGPWGCCYVAVVNTRTPRTPCRRASWLPSCASFVRPNMARMIQRNGRVANLSFRLSLEQHDDRRRCQDAARQQQPSATP